MADLPVGLDEWQPMAPPPRDELHQHPRNHSLIRQISPREFDQRQRALYNPVHVTVGKPPTITGQLELPSCRRHHPLQLLLVEETVTKRKSLVPSRAVGGGCRVLVGQQDYVWKDKEPVRDKAASSDEEEQSDEEEEKSDTSVEVEHQPFDLEEARSFLCRGSRSRPLPQSRSRSRSCLRQSGPLATSSDADPRTADAELLLHFSQQSRKALQNSEIPIRPGLSLDDYFDNFDRRDRLDRNMPIHVSVRIVNMLQGNASGLGRVILPANILMTVWGCKKEDAQIETELQRYLDSIPTIPGVPLKKQPGHLFLAPGVRKDDWHMQLWVLPQRGHDDRLRAKLSPLNEYLDDERIAVRDTRLYLEAHLVWSGQAYDESEDSFPNYDVCHYVYADVKKDASEKIALANDSAVEDGDQKRTKKKKKLSGNQRKKNKYKKVDLDNATDAMDQLLTGGAWPDKMARERIQHQHEDLRVFPNNLSGRRRDNMAQVLAAVIEEGTLEMHHLTAHGLPRYPLEDVTLRTSDTYFPEGWLPGFASQQWLRDYVGLEPLLHADGSTAVWCAVSEVAWAVVKALQGPKASKLVPVQSIKVLLEGIRDCYFAW